MKKYLLLILLLIIPVTVNAGDHTYLYDVLKNAAEEGTYAKEYTGNHNDIMGGGNKKIYYWYSENDTSMRGKWNVLFGGYCWQAFRTTDGGGTKLIYNGKAVNNKCESTRTNSANFYIDDDSFSSGTSFYYGDDFTWEGANGLKFYLTNAREMTLNDDNASSLEGKYACLASSYYGYCSKLIRIYRYSHKFVRSTDTLYYYTVQYYYNPYAYVSSNDYFLIGQLGYTENVDMPNRIGYMYDKDIEPIKKEVTFGNYEVNINRLGESDYNVIQNNSTNTYTFNDDEWKLQISGNKTSTIKFKINSSGNYILNYSFNCDRIGLTIKRNNDNLKKFNYSSNIWMDKKIFLNDINENDEIEVTVDNSYSRSAQMSFYIGTPNGEVNDNRIAFGNSFEYSNGKYHLKNVIYNDGTETVGTNKYTCASHATECNKIMYAVNAYDGYSERYIYGFEIEDGNGIEYITDEIYNKEDLNKNDSITKTVIDEWFEKNLIDYSSYLEPIIFCNDRKIYNESTNSLNINGTEDPKHIGYLFYNNYDQYITNNNNILHCERQIDQFSVNNPKAKLKYSVALPTANELYILSSKNNSYPAYRENNSYATMTPYTSSSVYMLVASSRMNYSYGGNAYGIRPVISLKANVEYESGIGTQSNPYVISDVMYSAITKENDDDKGSLTVVGDLEDIRNNTEITFTVENKEGFNIKSVKVLDDTNNEIELTITGNTYKFNMPTSDVRIITEYTAVLNMLNTLKNMNTALIAIILVIIGYGAYILIKKRK